MYGPAFRAAASPHAYTPPPCGWVWLGGACVSGFSCGLFMLSTFFFWRTWQGKPRVHLGRGSQGAVEKGYT